MNYPERLYLFVIMPPEELSEQIHKERIGFAQKFGFIKGLKPPVHISLTDIITVPVDHLAEFELQISKVQNWADSQLPFRIELRHFNFFENKEKPVLFIDVVKNAALAGMQKELAMELKRFPLVKTKTVSFTPHITIGYRDIPKDAFPEIKDTYRTKEFHGIFHCAAIHLWKHEFGKWQMVQQFNLKGLKKREQQLELF